MKKMTDQEFIEHTVTHDKTNSWWAHDVRGIPLCRVCEKCEDTALAGYRPEVTGHSGCRYEDVVEERIEDDY